MGSRAQCRVFPQSTRVPRTVMSSMTGLSTPLVSDVMDRTGAATRIRPIPGQRTSCFVGAALTVKTIPGDNIAVHAALRLLRPGDVLAVDGGGYVDRALVGEIIVRVATSRGCAAVVIDGAARDATALAELETPVFVRGVCCLGPHKNGPGELRGTIVLGGTSVRNGDVLIGDADGVVAVPADQCERVAKAAREKLIAETATMATIADGTYDDAWVESRVAVETG